MRFILLNSHTKVINVIAENTAPLAHKSHGKIFLITQHTFKHLSGARTLTASLAWQKEDKREEREMSSLGNSLSSFKALFPFQTM